MPRAARRFARNFDASAASNDAMAERHSIAHWPEYLIEAGALAVFMLSAAAFATLLYHPLSPVGSRISSEWLRRGLMGLAMGSTAVSIIYSRPGQRSGAHMNPALTFTYFRLGKVARTDFIGYVIAQFVGGVAGIALAAVLFGVLLSHPSVNYVATMPGARGEAAAFAGELTITFVLMSTVLAVSNTARFARFTGLCAGLLVWMYITFEQPLSGMSLNPARTFASAFLAGKYAGLWIYFTAPPLGMLLSAEAFTRRYGLRRVVCAKLHHPATGPCIFHCGAKPSVDARIEAA
jgi:aquaporin Z